MNVDKANLKALAEASGPNQWYSAGDLRYCDDKTGEIHGLHHDDSRFIAAASPATVLALLAEIERGERLFEQSERALDRVNSMWHRRWLAKTGEPYPIPALGRDEEYDQLKAENEALRKDAERYRWLCDGNGYFLEESGLCGHGNEKAEADKEIDEAMAKEAK